MAEPRTNTSQASADVRLPADPKERIERGRSRRPMMYLVSIFFVLLTSSETYAGFSLFRTETLALRHCPSDEIVWLDLSKNIYYLKHQKRYGKGYTGAYVCRSEAKESGYRRSIFGRR